MSTSTSAVPAIEGWFTTDAEPHLLGTKCAACGTYFFPREETLCRNPACGSTDLPEVRLSRTGKVWSYTNAGYQPPDPYVPTTDPFEPFAIAAVQLAEEDMVILGQVADGFGVDDIKVGDEVELVVETLFTEDGVDQLTWRWRPTSTMATGSSAGSTGEDD